ncbi:MAG: polyphosphate kinase 1 [Deltaproteobacteria bacterium]|nr:MAG: polyphosphate kinase 1 [Deltaproteobacteria bacterium]
MGSPRWLPVSGAGRGAGRAAGATGVQRGGGPPPCPARRLPVPRADDATACGRWHPQLAPSRVATHVKTGHAAPSPSHPEVPVETKPVALDPSLYLNRELSLLEFNRRVLAQALDPTVPLLERLRFLTICSSNLDEFFEIRVAGVKQRAHALPGKPERDGMLPSELLHRISVVAHELVTRQYAALNEQLLPALEAERIRIPRRSRWSRALRTWARAYFHDQVQPVLTPMGLDPVRPFPKVLNKGLNFLITLEGTDAFGRNSGLAVLQVPRCLPRLIPVPPSAVRDGHEFVLLSSIIHAHIEDLFPGMSVTGCHQFRVTRNSDLWVDEEEVENLKQALQGELAGRRYGEAVRLEVAQGAPDHVAEFLLHQFALDPDDLYQVDGPVNLHRLGALVGLVDAPHLKYPPHVPRIPRRFSDAEDPFEAIASGDILLHHPYQSFQPVIELLQEAARDPDVLAIKQTLYRTGDDSPLVDALVEAAQAGKVVTAVVELRARFDEAANINLADRLEAVGANVVYGVVGRKCHAKLTLIVRREEGRLRRYVHLGTGNYHAGTARAYTDFGYLTADEQFGEDAHKLFTQLTGLGRAEALSQLLQSPFTLHRWLHERIAFETAEARAGRPAAIMARMNSLSEPSIIAALYEASRAGVRIDLLVRGICCLRPGVPGVSDNITVRSVVGRFLEHSRVYRFHAAGQDLVYCSSADWMNRNLHRRVEVAWPIHPPELHARVVEEGLEIYWRDDTQSWQLQSDGSYTRRTPGETPTCAQEQLMARLS